MKIMFMGTSPFAVESLSALHAAGADVAVMGSAVFNDPDPRALVAQVQAL